MALPDPDDLKTMDYAFQAQPHVSVAAKTSIETTDFAFQAQPFFVPQTPAAPSSVKKGAFFAFFS